MNKVRTSIGLLGRLNKLRAFSTTSKCTSGSDKSHGDDHGHDHVERKKATWLLPAEGEHYYRGYVYREVRNLQGDRQSQILRYALGFMWFWVFYSFWKKSEDFFGHAPYPDTSQWTDKELGIPPDDLE
jgi:hypothetical protein